MQEPAPMTQVSQRGWKQIDEEVDAIVSRSADPEVKHDPSLWNELERLKARARGKAEILAVVMRVGWPMVWSGATADDISAEAQRRLEMRTIGREYGTIGVESSTRQVTATSPGWMLAPDKRGVVRVDGGA